MIMKTIIGAFLMILVVSLNGQTEVSYGYNSTGNRTSRTIHFTAPPTKSTQNASGEEQPDEEYVDQLSGIDFSIYPNPTQGRLVVKMSSLPEGEKMFLTLFDANGRRILTKDPLDTINELDIQTQPSGIYILRIGIGKTSISWKVIKQ